MTDQERFAHWLKGQSSEVAQIISLRIALRVFPIFLNYSFDLNAERERSVNYRRLLFTTWRDLFLLWAALKYNRLPKKIADSERNANDGRNINGSLSAATYAAVVRAAIDAAIDATRYASIAGAAPTSSDATDAAIYAAEAADAAARAAARADSEYAGAREDIWRAINEDVAWISRTLDFSILILLPLWISQKDDPYISTRTPKWASHPFKFSFIFRRVARDASWGLWNQWYQALLPAADRPRSAFGEAADIEIAAQPNVFWERDSHAVMRAIEEIIERHRGMQDKDEGEVLGQRPANHAFRPKNGKLAAEPQLSTSVHGDVAADIREEIVEKAQAAAERLARSNTPQRVRQTIERVRLGLGQSISDVRAGVIQMRARTLEADLDAYDTANGRAELSEDAFAMLKDLSASLDDLLGCYPQLAEIEAERVAQKLAEADTAEVIDQMRKIRETAEESNIVDRSSVDALREGDADLADAQEILDSAGSENAKRSASVARNRIAGAKLLVTRNFVAAAIRMGAKEAGEFGGKTWGEFKTHAPAPLAKTATAVAVYALVAAFINPVAAIGFSVTTFAALTGKGNAILQKLQRRGAASETDGEEEAGASEEDGDPGVDV